MKRVGATVARLFVRVPLRIVYYALGYDTTPSARSIRHTILHLQAKISTIRQRGLGTLLIRGNRKLEIRK